MLIEDCVLLESVGSGLLLTAQPPKQGGVDEHGASESALAAATSSTVACATLRVLSVPQPVEQEDKLALVHGGDVVTIHHVDLGCHLELEFNKKHARLAMVPDALPHKGAPAPAPSLSQMWELLPRQLQGGNEALPLGAPVMLRSGFLKTTQICFLFFIFSFRKLYNTHVLF